MPTEAKRLGQFAAWLQLHSEQAADPSLFLELAGVRRALEYYATYDSSAVEVATFRASIKLYSQRLRDQSYSGAGRLPETGASTPR